MTPREIFDIMVRETVYKKLASPEPIKGSVWLGIFEIVARLDPEEFNRTPYSKYALASHYEPILDNLEKALFIVERRDHYAIHDNMMAMILSRPKAVVDSYLDKELKG